MIAHIIGCGDSGSRWPGTGFSIGVNDCWKFGKETSALLLVNSLLQFPERRKIVDEARPRHGLYTNQPTFRNHPCYKPLTARPVCVPIKENQKGRLEHYGGRADKIYQGRLYMTGTSSPIIAVSIAWGMGFDKIILWGVDFVDHRSIFGKKKDREVSKYADFNRALNRQGASMYLGATETFNNTGSLAGLIPNFKYVNG